MKQQSVLDKRESQELKIQDRDTMSATSEPVKRKKIIGDNSQRPKRKTEMAGRQTSEKKQTQPLDVIAIAMRRKPQILASCLVGLLIGSAYYLLLPPKYESRSAIMLIQNESTTMATHLGAGKESVSQDLLATHMSLIQSDRIIQQALANKQLLELPSLTEKITEKRTIVDYVNQNLYVTRGGKGSARNAHTLNIAFRHTDQEDCKSVVSAVVSEYQNFVSSKFRDINEEAVKLINTARLELDQELDQLNTNYKNFRNSSPLILSDSRNVHELRYQDLASEISKVSIQMDEAKGRLRLVVSGLSRLGEDAHPLEKLSLIDERSAARLGILVSVERGESQTAAFQALQPERAAGATTEYSKLLELKTKLTNSRVVYGPRHPQVQELETQINEIEKFLNQRKSDLGLTAEDTSLKPDDVMNAYVRLLRNDILVMEQRLQDLSKQQMEAETEAKKLVSFELENEDIIRRRARLESLYDSVVSRLKDINMRQDATGLIQEEIQAPTTAERVSPSGTIGLLVTMLSSVLFAGLAVLISELRDTRVHTLQELEQLYGANVIGQIPDFSKDTATRKLLKELRKSNLSTMSPELIAYHDTKSTFCETIRTIRTQILFSLGAKGQVIAITSPQQGDGKSTITSNLAISLACANKRVVLVDCDLRRPNVHNLFGLNPTPGLSDVCLGHIDLEDSLQSTLVENLRILTSGNIPENPSELLCTEPFSQVLQTLRDKFDLIVLDCPPVLPVTDATVIAPQTDGIVVVTKPDGESLIMSQECHRITSRLNCNLLGLVVNRSEFLDSGYYKKYQGYYQANSQ